MVMGITVYSVLYCIYDVSVVSRCTLYLNKILFTLQCIAAYNFDRNLSRSNASIFIYKLTVGLYFMILHLISYFHKCTALLWG